LDSFGNEGSVVEDKVDVIIVDAFDLSTVVEINELCKAFANALGDEGLLVAQVGSEYDDATRRFMEVLAEEGFESIVAFGEASNRKSFLLAVSNRDARVNWFKNEAEVQLAARNRILPTKSGKEGPLFFDGASMMHYQFPSRVIETAWCREQSHACEGGHGFDPLVPNVPVSLFEVKPSSITNGGRGVFSKRFIPKGSIVGLEECVHGMHAYSTTYELLESAYEFLGSMSSFWSTLYLGYFDGYGWMEKTHGRASVGIDAGIMTFVQHGCCGKYNIGVKLNMTESTVDAPDAQSSLQEILGNEHRYAFNPFAERHFPLWQCEKSMTTLHDIEAGEEMFDNYLMYGGEEDWEENLAELKTMCSGGIGTVTQYEDEKANNRKY